MVVPVPAVKRYKRAGLAIFDYHGNGDAIYGELVRCKRCKAVLYGTEFKFHDHWHDEHEGEVPWEVFSGMGG